jgi:hypothetical protein
MPVITGETVPASRLEVRWLMVVYWSHFRYGLALAFTGTHLNILADA